MVNRIVIKTSEEMKIMAEGGAKLARVKNSLKKEIKAGVNANDIESLATELIIKKEGAKPSFRMVPGYNWTTCVNINEGVVHGIPKKEIVFERGDVVSVDVGVFYKGFHTDTSITVGIQVSKENQKFLDTGEEALRQAIKATRTGNRIFDISQAIEKTLARGGYSPVRALVGHGVGRELHEEPQIPCFADELHRSTSPEIMKGMVLAIEVMYSQGSGDVKLENDGWTISSSDDTITALFEDTVAITKEGSKVLT